MFRVIQRGGAERAETEYRDLLRSGGFNTMRILPAGRFSIVEGKASSPDGASLIVAGV